MSKTNLKKELTIEEREKILKTLKIRFGENMIRHKGIEWEKVQEKLEKNIEKLWSLSQMEASGGDPDIIGYDKKTGEYIFCDCSPETPKDRRSLCYDRKAHESRKSFKPKSTAMDMAETMGIKLLNEEEYRDLQKLGEFDLKTSSWIRTPENIRKLGGAIFADRRFDTIFVYHNTAESYYGSRGFRGLLRV